MKFEQSIIMKEVRLRKLLSEIKELEEEIKCDKKALHVTVREATFAERLHRLLCNDDKKCRWTHESEFDSPWAAQQHNQYLTTARRFLKFCEDRGIDEDAGFALLEITINGEL